MAGWLDSTVGALQSGYAPSGGASPFPDYVPPPSQEDEAKAIWERIQAEEAARNAGADRRNLAGMTRGPIGNPGAGLSAISEPAISMALGGGMQAPANPSAPFGPIPPSLALARAEKAPQPPDQQPMAGPIPMPQPRPPSADAPTDLSSQARGQNFSNVLPPNSAGAPMSIAGPPGPPPAPPPVPMSDRIAGLGPAMLAVGGALQGDNSIAAGQAKRREDFALQAQQGNATARLLASKGAPPAEVQAAMTAGPDAVKALLGEYLGKDKWKVVQTGEDARGHKTFMQQNETDGSLRPVPGSSGPTSDPTSAAAAAGITGDEFLKAVPDAQDRSLIKQLTQYDLDPGKLSAKGGNRERLLALAEQYDPDFKAALYAPRAAALKEFTSGGPNAPASIITNGNTAIQHLGRMSELAERLGGTNKAWIANGLVNWANIKMEDMKNNPDLAAYKAAEDRFVEEATKFYRGVGGNKSDIDRALSILTPGQSPDARRAAIQEQAELMQSKINALQDRYKSAVGPSGWKKAVDLAGSEFPIVQEKSARAMDVIRKRASGEDVPAGAGVPVKPGAYIWDPHRGLVPK